MTLSQPPEWAPHASVWIGFPSAADLWLDDLEGAQAEVAAFARAVHGGGKGEVVRLVCANPEAEAAARDLAGDIAEIIAAPFFDIWLRDTGPIIVSDGGNPLALDYRGNGWGGKYPSPLDDDLARLLCEQAALLRSPRDWILEGGAIDVDGAGLCVTTGQCLLNPNRNPNLSRADIEARLCADLGLSQILWLGVGLENDHTDGHVDNLARFVAPGVLALPAPFGDDDPNAAIFADAADRAARWPVEIVTIPSAGRHMDEDGAAIPASHMNFYIGNACVVVPTYGGPSDDAAVAVIAKLFPGRETIGLRANHILTGGGSFHCISQQVPTL
ncbi:MAG: agmatine deiminase family protein [Sphingomonadaceae bacterium]